jgi:hypothetical protein
MVFHCFLNHRDQYSGLSVLGMVGFGVPVQFGSGKFKVNAFGNPDGGIYFVPMYLRERVVTMRNYKQTIKEPGRSGLFDLLFYHYAGGSVILGSTPLNWCLPNTLLFISETAHYSNQIILFDWSRRSFDWSHLLVFCLKPTWTGLKRISCICYSTFGRQSRC